MSASMIQKLREKAKYDRYFLGFGVLGYKDINPYTHGPLCRAIEDRSKKRRMYLSPRGHLKSTLCTVTDSIGLSLEDPEETRILLINEIEDNSVGFLAEIKAHWESNEVLALLFPELVPTRITGPGSKWSSTKACLPRKTAYKEWTYNAIGLGGAVVSRHYTRIKNDDLIGLAARESAADMQRAIRYSKTLEPLLVDANEDMIDWIGTRWALYDLYREMLLAYGDDMSYFSREDIELLPEHLELATLREAGFGYAGRNKPELPDEQVLAKRGTFQPIFPRKFSLEYLQRLSIIDPVLYYAQYKNSPIADGMKDFHPEKLNWFDFDEDGSIVYRDKNGYLQRWPRESLDVVMTVDPNSGSLSAPDFPAIIVSAQSPLDQIFVLDAWSRRVAPDTFVDQIYEMWQRWQPRALGIEEAGQQQTAFYFKKKAKETGVYIFMQKVTPRNRVKAERVRKQLQPIINQGRMYVRKSQATLRHQIRFFPDLENDDEIDALAYGAELWRSPLSAKDQEEEEEAVERVYSRRSRITGYSRG